MLGWLSYITTMVRIKGSKNPEEDKPTQGIQAVRHAAMIDLADALHAAVQEEQTPLYAEVNSINGGRYLSAKDKMKLLEDYALTLAHNPIMQRRLAGYYLEHPGELAKMLLGTKRELTVNVNDRRAVVLIPQQTSMQKWLKNNDRWDEGNLAMKTMEAEVVNDD